MTAHSVRCLVAVNFRAPFFLSLFATESVPKRIIVGCCSAVQALLWLTKNFAPQNTQLKVRACTQHKVYNARMHDVPKHDIGTLNCVKAENNLSSIALPRATAAFSPCPGVCVCVCSTGKFDKSVRCVCACCVVYVQDTRPDIRSQRRQHKPTERTAEKTTSHSFKRKESAFDHSLFG